MDETDTSTAGRPTPIVTLLGDVVFSCGTYNQNALSARIKPCSCFGYTSQCCHGGPQRFACKSRKYPVRNPLQTLLWRLIDNRYAKKRAVAGKGK